MQFSVVESLAEARLQAGLAMANSVPEFAVVSEPVTPGPLPRPSQTIPVAGVFLVVFAALWAGAMVVVLCRDIVAGQEAG
jgi:hypothetical protein